MDLVFIEDLRIETIIGIYDWERTTRQVVAFDVEMAFDNTKPAASERIEDTLNYKAVSKRLIDGARLQTSCSAIRHSPVTKPTRQTISGRPWAATATALRKALSK